jgi:antitoxin (DNA-binding transcriptional repressor) of toxin-antitoxin stability system
MVDSICRFRHGLEAAGIHRHLRVQGDLSRRPRARAAHRLPVVITRRGQPVAEVVPPSPPSSARAWIGSMRGTATIVGDLVEPATAAEDWEALEG